MGFLNFGPRTLRVGDISLTAGTPIARFPYFGTAYYVDGDNGSDAGGAANGKSSTHAFATIAAAITAASDGDTIFIKTRTMPYTQDTDPVSYAEALTIPASKRLALIGQGGGPVQGQQPQIKKGSGTAAQLTIRSAGCYIRGLTFNGISATGGGILLDDDLGVSKSAFGTVIEGCMFKNCLGADVSVAGAIRWTAAGNAWQVRIVGNRFYKNVTDICIPGTGTTVPQDVVIEDNIFSSPAAMVDCNIYVAGSGVGGLFINRNVFPVLPALSTGTVKKFYSLATGCLGAISNNAFGSTALTFGGTNTGGGHPATMFLVNNRQQAAVAQEAANLSPIGYTA